MKSVHNICADFVNVNIIFLNLIMKTDCYTFLGYKTFRKVELFLLVVQNTVPSLSLLNQLKISSITETCLRKNLLWNNWLFRLAVSIK